MGANTFIGGPQKWIGCQFAANLRWHGWLIGGTPRGDIQHPSFELCVMRINGYRKGRIGSGIFMGAIDLGLRWQSSQLLKARPHLFHRAFKHAPTAQREQAIANKSVPCVAQMIGNMAERMARNIQHLGAMGPQHDDVALINRAVNTGNFIGFTSRADNLTARGLFDFKIISGMIIVMMGVPNMAEPPAFLVQAGQYGSCLWGVNTGGFTAYRVVHQIAVIVTQAFNLFDYKARHLVSPKIVCCLMRFSVAKQRAQYRLLSMSVDIIDLAAFYATPLGRYVQQRLTQTMNDMWPAPDATHEETVIGYGFGTPLFSGLWPHAEWQFLMPAQIGVMVEHGELGGHVAMAEENQFPLRDSSVNRLIAVHGVEVARDVDSLLEEFWRVLVPEGRVLLVVPNRGGFWAGGDATPFGFGRPYSRRQLRQTLSQAGFDLIHFRSALIMPPFLPVRLMTSLSGLERISRFILPQFNGVWVVEAVKRVPAPIKKQKRVRLPAAALPRPAFSRNWLFSADK